MKRIFSLCIDGYEPSQIATILRNDKIECPVSHNKLLEIISSSLTYKVTSPYCWNPQTISAILDRIEYLGHTVNFKTHKKSYKCKKTVANDKSEWQIFENTHEAIISEDVFEIVKGLRSVKRVLTPLGDPPILSGLVYCADCGKKLYQVRSRRLKEKDYYLMCGNYRRNGTDICACHHIRNIVLEEIILSELKQIADLARNYENEFVELITNQSKAELARRLKDSKKKLDSSKTRINKLDGIIQKLYEDNLDGKITEDRYTTLLASYETEQATLKERVKELTSFIEGENERCINTEEFIKQVKKYTEFNELTPEILNTFISKVLIHETKVIDGKKHQEIEIYYNGIGKVQLSSQN